MLSHTVLHNRNKENTSVNTTAVTNSVLLYVEETKEQDSSTLPLTLAFLLTEVYVLSISYWKGH